MSMPAAAVGEQLGPALDPDRQRMSGEQGHSSEVWSSLPCTRTLCLALLAMVSLLLDLHFDNVEGSFIPSGGIIFFFKKLKKQSIGKVNSAGLMSGRMRHLSTSRACVAFDSRGCRGT